MAATSLNTYKRVTDLFYIAVRLPYTAIHQNLFTTPWALAFTVYQRRYSQKNRFYGRELAEVLGNPGHDLVVPDLRFVKRKRNDIFMALWSTPFVMEKSNLVSK